MEITCGAQERILLLGCLEHDDQGFDSRLHAHHGGDKQKVCEFGVVLPPAQGPAQKKRFPRLILEECESG